MSKMRTPEQKSKKMLKEEMTLLDLEMAIKKEQFRKTQSKPEFNELPKEIQNQQMISIPIPEKDVKNESVRNRFLSKLGF